MPEKRRRRRRSQGTSKSRLAVGYVVGALLLAGTTFAMVRGPFRREARPTSELQDAFSSTGGGPPLRLVGAPGFEAEVVRRDLEPIRAYLEDALEMTVTLTPSPSVEEALRALLQSEVSAAVLPAVGCLQAREWGSGVRYLALQAYDEAFDVDALLVGRAGDGAGDLRSLRGRRVCYVDRGSTAGYLAARSYLRNRGLDPETFFAESTMSGGELQALEDLHADQCDVAAVSEIALANASAAGLDQRNLRTIAVTAHLPGSCWVGAPRLDDGDYRRLRDALHGFDPAESGGARVVGPVLRISGFRAVDSSTFRGVRLAARLEGLLRRPRPDES